MDGTTWSLLHQGFSIALQPHLLLYSFAGAFLGTVVGVLPGIGSPGAVALLIPILAMMDPVGAVIMLAATYTGSMYGGSTTSILLRIPGDTSAVVATLDGHEMAKQGRAGSALCIAAIGSYIAGTIAVAGLMIVGPIIAEAALAFAAPEYFALYVFGLSAVVALAGRSLVKALMAMCFGLMIATVGEDIMGVQRYTFGSEYMWDGIHFLAVSLGLFALSEVIINAQKMKLNQLGEIIQHRIYIRLKEVTESLGAIFRGGVTGFLVGVLPGAGAGVATFISYSLEKQISRHPERFGKGEIKGLAGPEAANNAASAGAFVPMLALGIPGSSTTAIMLGAFLMLNIDPGPLLFLERPDVVWGLIAALYVGNIMLIFLNIPLIGIFVRILYTPMHILLVIIVVFAVIGTFLNNGLTLTLLFLIGFGVIGYFMRVYDFPLAPVILGVVLGSRMERSFRQSMSMSQGDLYIFLNRPIVISFLLLSVAFLAVPALLRRRGAPQRLVEDTD
jgi:putative tricarboxylic transport membrane protein